jgi:hypothetical protein
MGVGSIMGSFVSTTIKFKEFLIAAAIVIGFIAIVWLISYCIRVMYVRIVWLRRSENLERFVQDIFKDMQDTISLYDALLKGRLDETVKREDDAKDEDEDEDDDRDEEDEEVTSSVQLEEWNNELKPLFGEIIAFLKQDTGKKDEDFGKSIAWYFKYNSIFQNKVDLFLYDSVFKEFRHAEFQPALLTPENAGLSLNDRGKQNCINRIQDVKDNLISPLPLQLEKFKALEQKIYESNDFVGKQKYIDFSVGIRTINMYMNVYEKTLKGMYENRRVSFFNFFITLVRPQWEKFIIEEVVNRWRDALSAQNENTTRAKFKTKWNNLRTHIREFIKSVWNKSEEIYNDG